MNTSFIGEENDLPCNPTRSNTVILTGTRFKMVESATFDNWVMGIVFPDTEKAQYFIDNFKKGMHDYREGMVKDNYVVHILHFKYPKPKELYADQIRMRIDYDACHTN